MRDQGLCDVCEDAAFPGKPECLDRGWLPDELKNLSPGAFVIEI